MTNKYDLHAVEWGQFQIGKICNIFTGAIISQSEMQLGNIPRISATDLNNGISTFTKQSPHTNYRKYKNFISISFLGSVFYHLNEVSLDMKIHGIEFKNKEMNRFLASFLIPLIKNFSSKYSYGYQLSTSVLKKQKILLPRNKSGNPDWDFMAGYMQEKEKQQLETALSYYRRKLGNKNVREMSLKNCKWKAFEIDYICNIFSGTRLTKTSMNSGNKPFIGATDSNNGITNFVSNSNGSEDSNVLGVNYNGSVVENFYHPYVCIFSDDVKRFKLKNIGGDQYKYLFLKRMILNQKSKYQYAYKFNGNRMKKQKILLPVNSTGEPDWKFIEQYMQYQEQKLVKKYIDFAEQKLILS